MRAAAGWDEAARRWSAWYRLLYRLDQQDAGEGRKNTPADTLQAGAARSSKRAAGRDASTRRLSFSIRRTSPLISTACYPPFGSI